MTTYLVSLLHLLLCKILWKRSHASLHARHGLYRCHLVRIMSSWESFGPTESRDDTMLVEVMRLGRRGVK